MAFTTPVFQLPEEVTNARQNAETLTASAQNLQAGEPTISDVLRQKVNELYNTNQDIIKPLDEATANYYSAPATAREKYQDVFNPFSREALVSQYTQNALTPVLSYSGMLGQRFGRVEDYIGAGTRAYQAQTQAALAKAELAQKQYQDALNEYLTVNELSQQQETQNLARDKFEWDKSHPSGGYSATAGEREQSRLLSSLQADVKRGLGVADIAWRYKDSGLGLSDIINTYDTYSPYGPHKESLTELTNLFGTAKALDPIDQLIANALSQAGFGSATSATLK